MDRVAEIKRLYYSTTKATLLRDLATAIDLLKSIESEEERERAAVYMDGLSQMRAEWGLKAKNRQSAVGSQAEAVVAHRSVGRRAEQTSVSVRVQADLPTSDAQ